MNHGPLDSFQKNLLRTRKNTKEEVEEQMPDLYSSYSTVYRAQPPNVQPLIEAFLHSLRPIERSTMTAQDGRDIQKPPHFFKIILDHSLRDGKLRIPKKFVRKCGEGLSNTTFLKLPTGTKWRVELMKRDGEVWLDKGWREFVEFCSIKSGHFLVFKYEGNSQFYVVVFDGSATEIDYPVNSSVDEEIQVSPMEEAESDNSVEIVDHVPTDPKAREKSPLPCPRPHKMMRTNPSGLEGISTTKQCPKFEVLRRTRTLSMDEKARALQKARGFKAKNPSFMVVMQSSYVRFERSSTLEIPSNFAKRYLNKDQRTIILRISDDRNWILEYVFKTNAGRPRGRFKYGWNVFAQDNNLEVGDVCVFELIQGNKVSFQVVIFRSSKEHCSASQGKLNFSAKEEGRDNFLRCPQSQGFKRHPVTVSLKDRALERASAFHSEKPFFMVVMAPSYLNGKGLLYIPAKFAEKYFSTEDGRNLTLRVSGERIWSVTYTFRQFGRRRRARLSTGWRAFARDNKLEEGDVCIFEFIKLGIEMSLEVLIFRVTEGENSTASPGRKYFQLLMQ
ncbi:B3 domain-containing transcription factor VRN1 [Morella rubra]|uniref:B3 domain-containing transcription factor VRN1 n=1 Tax=Morella rubra TaxID=262757 RepID=A0A6A1UYC9_9ROSI|nr:B3 domain-containing transcription factor VRN1 [Morella rubra]